MCFKDDTNLKDGFVEVKFKTISGREDQAGGFVVMFDGKQALDWDDQTFKEAGKVGVWTKADSVTLFDDFSYGDK